MEKKEHVRKYITLGALAALFIYSCARDFDKVGKKTTTSPAKNKNTAAVNIPAVTKPGSTLLYSHTMPHFAVPSLQAHTPATLLVH